MYTLRLEFTHDLKNTDGTAYAADQFAGVEYAIDGAAFVSVPAAYAADGNFAVEVDGTWAVGDHVATVRLKHVDGTASEASDPAGFTVAARVPTKPMGLSAVFGA